MLPYRCIDPERVGEYVGPFLELEKLPRAERTSLSTTSPIVQECGRVCMECANLSSCADDNDLWVIGKPMRRWYSLKPNDLPQVHGARLLFLDEHRLRMAVEIPFSSECSDNQSNTTEEPPEVLADIAAYLHEIIEEVTDESPAEEGNIPSTPHKTDIEVDRETPPSAPSIRRYDGGTRSRKGRRSDVPPDDDLVKLYLKGIGQYPLITKSEEVELGKIIEEGRRAEQRLLGETLSPSERRAAERQARLGKRAYTDFVNANYRLVVSIAKKYQSSGMDLMDLIQEGNLGMMHAVEKFDYRKGFKFSTYATWWIRQAITRGIANTGRTIRLPVHAGDTLARIHKIVTRIERENGTRPTLTEIATQLGMPEGKILELMSVGGEVLSLSMPVGDDGDAEFGDFLEDKGADNPEELAMLAMERKEIEQLIAPLDEREQEIIRMRFGLDNGEPATLEDVGRHFNLTRERIRQLESRALSKLRHPVTA